MTTIRINRIGSLVKVAALAFFLSFLFATTIVYADNTLFTETCNSNPTQALNNSTTVTGGTWSAEIALVGTNSITINSGTSNCSATADTVNIGVAHTMSTTPSTATYYVDADVIDGGTIAATSGMGILMNYIDADNYYVCLYNDDAATGVFDVYILRAKTGANSTLNSATNISGMTSGDTVRCQISYDGSTPTITITNTTDGIEYLTATDSGDPLTETRKAGVMCGASDVRTTDDCESLIDIDDITLVEVTSVAPTVTTGYESNVGATTAYLYGTISSDGGNSITTYGFATSTSATLATGVSTSSFGSITAPTVVATTSKGHSANTQYFFRFYATNAIGTSYGSIHSFTTGNTNTTRRLRLFENFILKLISGKIYLFGR